MPPGPYRKQIYGGVYLSGASVAAGVTNVDAIHGACFTIPDVTTITHVGTYLMTGTTLAEDTVLSVWVGLASDPPPDEATTPHGTILLWAGTQPSGSTAVKLTTPWIPPVDTPLIVWFGSTGSPVVNEIKTTATGIDDIAVQSAVEYVVRPRGGVKTDQIGRFIGIYLYVAGTGTTVWQEAITISPPTSTPVGADLYTFTLDGSSVLFDPSLYRRADFTTGVPPTTVTLQNPTPPAVGECVPAVTLLIRTPAATTPGIITWVNLTGGSFIPLPAASQVVAAQLEWVDEIIGWLVVGVRA